MLSQGSKGNTPLHYACLLERTKHAELLLEYGALPDARNEHGQRPLDLLPRDAVRSTKLYFKRIFDVRTAPHCVVSYVCALVARISVVNALDIISVPAFGRHNPPKASLLRISFRTLHHRMRWRSRRRPR
jgi:hypothetical protein